MKGFSAADLMAGGSINKGVYAYDATSGYNQKWVTTADEFQAATGITDAQKEQMFHCNSSKWSTGWVDGDYTSMWGTDPSGGASKVTFTNGITITGLFLLSLHRRIYGSGQSIGQ